MLVSGSVVVSNCFLEWRAHFAFFRFGKTLPVKLQGSFIRHYMNMFRCNIRWCCPIVHGIVSHGAVSHGIDQDVELDEW